MKNYVAPISAVLSMNLNENIAKSEGNTTTNWAWDPESGLITNQEGLPKATSNSFAILAWISAHGGDANLLNACAKGNK